MSCYDCPDPALVPRSNADEFCLMPRLGSQVELINLLKAASLVVNDDCSIESEIPIEGLRQDGNRYYLDYVSCMWKLIKIKLPKIEFDCILHQDTSKCETCPNRHTK